MQQQNKILAISAASFFWSTSSLMATSILPIFLIENLHIGYAKIGYMEGIAIFVAFITKVFSGIISDWLQKRRILIILGSIISVITKIMFAVSNTYFMIFIARFTDRLAKGIRSAPTDALIADLNEKNLSYAFNFRQAWYVLGSVFGASLSIFIMFLIGLKYQIIFYASLIPALMAVLILLFFVRDLSSSSVQLSNTNKPQSFGNILTDLQKFPGYYWVILIITFFLMISRFSESFLSLKVKQFGWSVYYLPIIIIILDLSHAYFAFISRKISTSAGTELLLILGLVTLIIGNIFWLFADSNLMIIISLILTGMQLGVTQGVLRTLIATSVPKLHGTAFSLFYLVGGCGLFISNLLAGTLAETFGLSTIFIGSMFSSFVALVILLVIRFYRNKVNDALLMDEEII